MVRFPPIAVVRSKAHSGFMSLDDHRRLVRKATAAACVVLALSIVAQTMMGADFRGLPFLVFALILGPPGLSLFGRTIWLRFNAAKSKR